MLFSLTMEVKLVNHKGENRIAIFCEKNSATEQQIIGLTGRKWSATLRAWHLPDTTLNRQLFNVNSIKQDLSTRHKKKWSISENTIEKVELLKRWMISKRYSKSTITTYCDALKVFLNFYETIPVNQLTNEHLINFNNDYIIKQNFSSSYQNQVINAIKLFFITVEDRKIDFEKVHRPKREKILPNVLSKEEVKLILNSLRNIKHKTMLSLIYSCGLRRSELINLSLKDVDSKRNLLIIRQAKGKKDRIAPLSDKMILLLREYYLAYKPKKWLFEGQGGAENKYDERSLVSVLHAAVEKAKISKPVTLHWLRHSYATHLLEAGTDIRYIQEILGHSRSTTTEIYTHVSTRSIQKVVSPFDSL